MIKKYCDRCGAEIKEKAVLTTLLNELADAIRVALQETFKAWIKPRFAIVDKKTGTEIELCKRCKKEFDIFMSEPYGPEGRPEDIQDGKKIDIVVADEEIGK